MAIKGALHRELVRRVGSQQTLSRWALKLDRDFGPMNPDEARLIIACDLGVRLGDFGVSPELQERVRVLKAAGATVTTDSRSSFVAASPPVSHLNPPTDSPSLLNGQRAMTPVNHFSSRNFHDEVTKSSRRLFASGHRSEAIHAAFRSVNNRVKRLSGLRGFDGFKLMNQAFSEQSPSLQLSGISEMTERDEHNGLRYLMAGAMLALRNPRVHEDDWQPDKDPNAALECLSFASLLHRFLDRCEEYKTVI